VACQPSSGPAIEPAFAGGADITVEVFAGVGYDGPLIGHTTRDPAGLSGFQGFAFDNLLTSIGGLYSFRVTSSSGRGAYSVFQHTPTISGPSVPGNYLGGHMLETTGAPFPYADFTFEVNTTGETAPVPEPATLTLFGTGACLAILRARRRSS
jgi:hypothetical protein